MSVYSFESLSKVGETREINKSILGEYSFEYNLNRDFFPYLRRFSEIVDQTDASDENIYFNTEKYNEVRKIIEDFVSKHDTIFSFTILNDYYSNISVLISEIVKCFKEIDYFMFDYISSGERKLVPYPEKIIEAYNNATSYLSSLALTTMFKRSLNCAYSYIIPETLKRHFFKNSLDRITKIAFAELTPLDKGYYTKYPLSYWTSQIYEAFDKFSLNSVEDMKDSSVKNITKILFTSRWKTNKIKSILLKVSEDSNYERMLKDTNIDRYFPGTKEWKEFVVDFDRFIKDCSIDDISQIHIKKIIEIFTSTLVIFESSVKNFLENNIDLYRFTSYYFKMISSNAEDQAAINCTDEEKAREFYRSFFTDDCAIPQSIYDFYSRVIKEKSDFLKTIEAIDASGNGMYTSTMNASNGFVTNKESGKDYKKEEVRLKKTFLEIFNIKKQKLIQKLDAMFYKKWFGRIPSLYQRYSSKALITENRMNGDPTKILLNQGVNYLNALSKDTESLFNEMIDLARQVASSGNIQAKISLVKNFCKQYPIETSSDPKEIESQFKNECFYRIANIILQGNETVYGYSLEGIVENGQFPNSNHIVTSIFIQNAHEKPEEQSVSDIFQAADSLTIFAKPERLNIVEETYRRTCDNIVRNFDANGLNTIKKNMDKNYQTIVTGLRRPQLAENEGANYDPSMVKKQVQSVHKGVMNGIDLVIEQKRRCLQCAGSLFDMMGRISKLGKRCISQMSLVERQNSDVRYSGANVYDAKRNISTNKFNKINYNNARTNYGVRTATAGNFTAKELFV